MAQKLSGILGKTIEYPPTNGAVPHIVSGKTEWSGAFGGFFLTEGLLNWYLETKRWPRGCFPCLKEGF